MLFRLYRLRRLNPSANLEAPPDPGDAVAGTRVPFFRSPDLPKRAWSGVSSAAPAPSTPAEPIRFTFAKTGRTYALRASPADLLALEAPVAELALRDDPSACAAAPLPPPDEEAVVKLDRRLARTASPDRPVKFDLDERLDAPRPGGELLRASSETPPAARPRPTPRRRHDAGGKTDAELRDAPDEVPVA